MYLNVYTCIYAYTLIQRLSCARSQACNPCFSNTLPGGADKMLPKGFDVQRTSAIKLRRTVWLSLRP